MPLIIAAFVGASAALVGAQSGTAGTACPAYPPLAATADVIADAGVQKALSKVKDLLAAAASKNPTGLVATIVLNQTVVWSGGFGKRKPNSDEPPRSSDLVRIASITKVFTDVLAFKMRDAGIVALDDPLSKHLRDFEMPRASRTRGTITLRNLASHTSGLPRETPYPCSDDAHQCSEADVLALLRDDYPVLPPFRRFHCAYTGFHPAPLTSSFTLTLRIPLKGRAFGSRARR